MPDLSLYGTSEFTDPNGMARAVAYPRFGKREAENVLSEGAQVTPYLADFVGAWSQPGRSEKLSVQDLNDRYGVEGYLSFDREETQAVADYKSRAAYRQAERERVLSVSALSGGEAFWQSLKGGALDPVAIPTYFFGLGEAKALTSIGQAGSAIGRARLVGSVAVRSVGANALGAAAVSGADWAFRTGADQDFSFGQAVDNIVVGAVLGGAAGGLFGGLKARGAGRAASPVRAVIAQAAARRGVDTGTLTRVAEIESDFNPSARNPNSSAGGLFQFIDDTWNGLGGGNKMDAALSADRAAMLMAENAEGLRKALGREPEPWELYLAHQQGQGGAKALLAAPDRLAVDIVGEKQVTLNGGRLDMTAGEFAGLWRTKFGSAGGAAPVRLPEAVALMSPAERAGTFEAVFDDMLTDTPTDIAALLPRERVYRAADIPVELVIPGRLLHADVAVTANGVEIPVRYAVVDAGDLVTTHGDDLSVRPDYPEAMRGGERGIAASRAQEAALDARRVTSDPAVARGAPVVTPEGVVLAGNGRSIALRRSAREGGEAYGRYRADLEAQGYDLRGIAHPVLVRVNAADMGHGDLIRMAREANGGPVAARPAPEPVAPSPLDGVRNILAQRTDFSRGRVAAGGGQAFTRAPDGGGVDPKLLFEREAPKPVEAEAKGIKAKLSARALIAADPELKALYDDVERLEAETGASGAKEELDTLAEAMRAVSFCILEGGAG